jgi:hypothetical protein
MSSLKRLLVAVFFIIVVEILSLGCIPPGWASLISGAVGSIILIVPPLRLEIWKAQRTRFRARSQRTTAQSEDILALDRQLEQKYTAKIDEHDESDALFLVAGGVLLGFYFIFQIPYKLELVDKDTLSHAISNMRKAQIDVSEKINTIKKNQSDLIRGAAELQKTQSILLQDVALLGKELRVLSLQKPSSRRVQPRRRSVYTRRSARE